MRASPMEQKMKITSRLTGISAGSPHPVFVKDRAPTMVAYPGWRWRQAEDGWLHEKIPNPILRFIDWFRRRPA